MNHNIILGLKEEQGAKQKVNRMLGAGALGSPRGMVRGGRKEGVQDGEHVYTRGGFMLMYGKTNTIL